MGSTRYTMVRKPSWIAAALLTGATLVAAPAAAEPVTATGKGITGGVLLGAELGMLPQAIAGVDKWWTYALGGGVGAVAGGVGGYFVESSLTSAEPALYMLAGGMALVIPTVVLTINATAYRPEAEDGETVSEEGSSDFSEPPMEAPTEAAPGDSAAPVAPSPAPASGAPAATPPPEAPAPTGPAPAPQARRSRVRSPRPTILPSLLGLDFSGRSIAVRPGIPAVDVQPLYSQREMAQYGLAPGGTQVVIPAIGGRF